jgi:coniferyl-aldehyde dehydrogenase
MRPSAPERIRRLQRLKSLLKDNKEMLMEAMREDYSARSSTEMLLVELVSTVQSINYMCRHLRRWMKPERRHVPLHLQPGRAEIVYQPLGVVGIVTPFNYPVMLACTPLATALAAGNRAMVKVPEATPRTSALMARLFDNAFPPDLVKIVTGELDVSVAFSRLPFDHLFFTGSSGVGRSIMRAAAENLTPVTLELGGKSPVIVDRDFDVEEAATRVCFAKSVNAGQTCIAPDYVLVAKERLDAFIAAYKAAFRTFFPTLANNPDVCAIISDAHVERLRGLVSDAVGRGATAFALGPEDIGDGTRRFSPVLLTGVDDSMRVMQEEIFGGVLPILTYEALDEALAYVNGRDKPLALYYLGLDRERRQQVIDETHSGGVAINELMIQAVVDDLPFGGIGPSGMGHYHGPEGFKALSKAKSVLVKPRFGTARLFYPPYGGRLSTWLLRYLLR